MKTQIASRLASLGLSAFFTLAMLGSVNHLATSEPSAELLIATAPAVQA